MLTTESMTCSATSAMTSGPRPCGAAGETGRRRSVELATAARSPRRAPWVNRVDIPSIGKAPRGFKTATVLLSRRGRKGCAGIKEIARQTAEFGLSHCGERTKPLSSTHQPHDGDSEHRRDHPGDSEGIF